MKRANGEGGFSLIETAVAALLTVGLMGATFALLNQNQGVYVSESSVTDMHENVRTAVDSLTRDVQSAGMGLPRFAGSFAAIFFVDGANGDPDKIMMVNGDPYAPYADVSETGNNNADLYCLPPPELPANSGTGAYYDKDNVSHWLYKSYSSDPKYYICYDDNMASVIALTADGQLVNTAQGLRLKLQHTVASDTNPASAFGSVVDTGVPNYGIAKIAPLSSLTAYRLMRQTGELERTEDLQNWYTIARGVINFQIEYRVVTGKDASGNDIESTTSAPADRRDIRSVTFTITAETPDLEPGTKGYRRMVQKFEVTPRNFNLLNNTNLSQ